MLHYGEPMIYTNSAMQQDHWGVPTIELWCPEIVGGGYLLI